MKIAITGATGFVGSRLVERLHGEGHQLLVLTRDRVKGQRIFPAGAFANLEIIAYSPQESGSWQQTISGCDAVINLAGEPIAERWTPERKEELLASRQIGTTKIVEAIAQSHPKPKVLINPSAIGYYGTSETATFTENSLAGSDFLAEVCQGWENAALKVKDSGVRLVIPRFGIILGVEGGALAKMIPPFKLFAGGPIGTGNQWFSWIHREDLIKLLIFSLNRSDVSGVINATAPNPVRMVEFCQALGEVLKRPSWLPVPSFALEMLLGDGAKAVLEGQQVLPQRTLSLGFEYQYPTVKQALANIL